MNKPGFCLYFIILSFCFLPSVSGIHSDTILRDTSKLRQMNIPEDFFSEFRSDQDFEYSAEINEKASTLVENFVRWLISHLHISEKYMNFLTKAIRVFLWVLAIAILLFTFIKMRFYRIFYTKEEPPPKDFIIESTQEEAEDLEGIIRNEILRKNFRKALRFQFLHVLRQLDNKDIISYSSEKTNFDYLQEIKGSHKDLASLFATLVNVYNAVWYGNFKVEEDEFNRLNSGFSEFNSLVNGKT